MSDYTPTTDEVRDAYVSGEESAGTQADFDRWLAEHDAAIWDESRAAPATATTAELNGVQYLAWRYINPYRQRQEADGATRGQP